MADRFEIRVQEAAFDPGAELSAMTDGRSDIGGVACFVGLVRDFASDEAVTALTLEHYPGMTEKRLAEICREAVTRWDLTSARIVHRVGRMLPGEPIVLTAAASPHRAAAFEACWFLIDWLKTSAPFWKLEETPDGERWVDAKASDDAAANRWRQE
ncbi:molybdenum cofactor biosynthesis protein MoaE [Lacibacterium aquatile]|uniref:Molybdopterin synthase catalytic subunit n=1 Tax=Lacibacterium aquatile TaxID=1168082 RepID=A0ABW5DVJ9_9PROT